MLKCRALWYNQDEVVKDTDIVYGDNEADCRAKAFAIYNGKPPAPMLILQEEK